MSLFKKLTLMSAISILPGVSMDAAAPKPTLDQIQRESTQNLADGNFDLRLTDDDWNGFFPGTTTSDAALDARSKVHNAMRLRTERSRVNTAIDAASQHKAAAQ